MPHDVAPMGAWHFDPGTLADLRLDKARQALDADQPDRALVEAEELLEAQPGRPEALAVVARAALRLGDALLALAALDALREAGADSGDLWQDVARARFLAADLKGALAAARAATDRSPDRADAWFQQALCQERLGRPGPAALAWQRAVALDGERFSLPPQVPAEVWDACLQVALSALPEEVRDFYAEVPVRWADFPEPVDLQASQPPLSPLLDGMYAGSPPDDPDDRADLLPACVWLFRGNLRLPSSDPGLLTRRIHAVLVNEAADWLGLSSDLPFLPDED